MKKIGSLLLLFVLFGCQAQKKEPCLIDFEEKIAPKINQDIIQGEVINIRDNINCLDWDALIIVMAGRKEMIEKFSPIKIPYPLEVGTFQYNDQDGFIFFLKGNTAVGHVHFVTGCRNNEKCNFFDFYTLGQKIIPKKDAVFEVYTQKVSNNQGNTWNRENALRIKL